MDGEDEKRGLTSAPLPSEVSKGWPRVFMSEHSRPNRDQRWPIRARDESIGDHGCPVRTWRRRASPEQASWAFSMA
jgi:hypothetical protein